MGRQLRTHWIPATSTVVRQARGEQITALSVCGIPTPAGRLTNVFADVDCRTCLGWMKHSARLIEIAELHARILDAFLEQHALEWNEHVEAELTLSALAGRTLRRAFPDAVWQQPLDFD